jgi:hypothetical protein
MDLAKTHELAAMFNRILASAPDVQRLTSVVPDYSGFNESAEAAAEWRAETEAAPMRAAELLEELLEEQRLAADEAVKARARDARRQVFTLVLVVVSVLIAAASFIFK